MGTAGVITGITRVVAVLAVAGVVAMHGLTTGHHAELPAADGAGGHSSVQSHAVLTAAAMSDAVMGDAVIGDAVTSTPQGGSATPEELVALCMAVLLVAATLLLLLGRARRRPWPGWAASTNPSRWTLHVPSPRPPSLFALGVLRT